MLILTRKAAAALAAAALAAGMAACSGAGGDSEGTPAEGVAPGAQEEDGAVDETTEEDEE